MVSGSVSHCTWYFDFDASVAVTRYVIPMRVVVVSFILDTVNVSVAIT